MLSRNVKRALLDSRWPLPPTFLLPWAATLTTVSHATEASNIPPPLVNAGQHVSPERLERRHDQISSNTPPAAAPTLQPANISTQPPALSESVRTLLPVLAAQGPHYITAHLYDRPYLLTAGDTVRLPFHMKNVEPGDVLRLNRASVLGSREYTLKAAAASPALKSPSMSSSLVLDDTTGSLESHSMVMPEPAGKVSYLDERLFVCRAVVMGVESEPLRVKEKTKRRQRKIKKVKSKHRYTILRVKEVRVRSLEDIEGGREE
ncbi:hypothetical protein LTR17_011071 [Elasticomyces elasticus]|nr:hypothetical protein LTR17_011071 [Elasticomyces elasticus]